MSGKEIHTKETFQVLGMSCAVCALNVETTLGAQEGVYEAKVNFAGSTVLVDYNPQVITPVELQKAVEAAGYELVVENTEDTDQADRLQREEFLALKRKTIGAIVLAIPVFVIGMFFMHMPYGNWIMLAFTIPVMAFFGRDFFVHAYMQLKHGRANMDTLVAVSTGVAFLFSLFNTIWPEYWTSRGLEAHVYYEAAAVIIALILLGRLLEAKAKFSTSTAIKKLMGLQPKTVTKILADGSEEEVPIREVAVGDVLVVKPGEKIPVDGEVTEGASFVDESMITGESIPVEKVKGQPVYAGTINEKGSFRFRADKVGGETVLANIIRMVQEAQGSKAPVQKLVDRIAGIFVPVVMGIAVITFIVWMLIGGDLAFTHALLTSITVLVIACPCALGLATPTAIMVGIGKGAEHNILIKDAESLELMYRVNAIVLDKTGTITEGKPVVTDIYWTPGSEDERYPSILLEIERRSEHPLADAVVQKFKEKVVNEISVSDFENQTGKGVTAKDVALYMMSKMTTSGATGYFVEYAGSAIRNLTMEGRLTLCNLSIEMGARGGMVAPDEVTFEYIKGRESAPQGEAWDKALAYWKTLKSDDDAVFDKEVRFEAADIEPMITYGTNPGMGMGITQHIPTMEGMSEAAQVSFKKSMDYMGFQPGESLLGKKIDYVFLGACTNGRIEDFRAFASIVKGRKKAENVIAWLVPGSWMVDAQIRKEGIDKILTEAGFAIRQPGCSACLAMNDDKIPAGKYSVSTSNRNFEGRQGPGARTLLASPLVAAAAAVTGVITDPRELM